MTGPAGDYRQADPAGLGHPHHATHQPGREISTFQPTTPARAPMARSGMPAWARDEDQTMRTHPNSAAYPAMAAALEYAALGIAVVACHRPTRSAGQPQPDTPPLVCSCGEPGCPTPAEHPLTSTSDATANLQRVVGYWSTQPLANVATPAGHSFDVLECHQVAAGEQLVTWLVERGIAPGPVIDLGDGRLRLPVRASLADGPSPKTARHAHCLPEGALVLLPPSRLVDGRAVTWLRPFNDNTILLPERDRLLDALAQLPGSECGASAAGGRHA
jgi:hypothetical protein